MHVIEENQCVLMKKYKEQIKINDELRVEIDTVKRKLAIQTNKNDQGHSSKKQKRGPRASFPKNE